MSNKSEYNLFGIVLVSYADNLLPVSRYMLFTITLGSEFVLIIIICKLNGKWNLKYTKS